MGKKNIQYSHYFFHSKQAARTHVNCKILIDCKIFIGINKILNSFYSFSYKREMVSMVSSSNRISCSLNGSEIPQWRSLYHGKKKSNIKVRILKCFYIKDKNIEVSILVKIKFFFSSYLVMWDSKVVSDVEDILRKQMIYFESQHRKGKKKMKRSKILRFFFSILPMEVYDFFFFFRVQR